MGFFSARWRLCVGSVVGSYVGGCYEGRSG